MAENDDLRVHGDRSIPHLLDSLHGIIERQCRARADGSLRGQAHVRHEDIGAGLGHRSRLLGIEDIRSGQQVPLMSCTDHLDLVLETHSGLLEVGTEGPVDEPDGGEVLHPGEACALDVVEEGSHDAEGIGAVDTGQHRRVLDHRKHLVRELSWTRSEVLPGFERLVDPARLLLVGTLSKLFWGGIRVGWIRGPRSVIGRLTDLRRSLDLAGSVLDQLAAVLLLLQAPMQQKVRRSLMSAHFEAVTAVLEDTLPTWRSWLPAGGSGLWIDTGTDAVALAQRALPLGIRLTAGPAFSPHDGHREFLRLPVWQPSGQFAEAMAVLAELSHHP